MREIRNSAIIRTPVDTGLLRSSHHIEVKSDFRGVHGTVFNIVEYAPYVHDGRGPIVPVTRKALKFRINGVTYIRKRVGPQKAQPWLRNAMVAVARKHKLHVIHP